MLLKSLRLITFDATNTLIQLAGKVGPEYAKIGQIYGVKGADDPLKIARLTDEFRTSFQHFNTLLPNYGYHQNISPVEWWSKVVLTSFENSGFDLKDPSDRKRVESTAAHLYKLYSRGSHWKLKDGAHDLLFELRKQRPEVELSVISNTDERLETVIHDLGVAHFFKHLFISHKIGLAKPDVELFEHAFKKHNITDPASQYLHIGDNAELDYKPVVEGLGGNAFLVNRMLANSEKEALEASGVKSRNVFSSLVDIHKVLLSPPTSSSSDSPCSPTSSSSSSSSSGSSSPSHSSKDSTSGSRSSLPF